LNPWASVEQTGKQDSIKKIVALVASKQRTEPCHQLSVLLTHQTTHFTP